MFETCRRKQTDGAEVIQIRRCRPSVLAAALALMLTMLFVYAAVMPTLPLEKSSAASADAELSTQLHMEGMEVCFRTEGRCEDALQARILAAQCVENGGAGLLLSEGKGYVVVREALSGDAQAENCLQKRASGLTLKLRGSAENLAAVTDAVAFLRCQAMETGSLAAALEQGETDEPSLCALLSVYRTQGRRVADALADLPNGAAIDALCAAVQGCLSRLDQVPKACTPSALRLVHAAACAEWIDLLSALQAAEG